MRPLPSPVRIIRVDYVASLGAIAALVIWVLALGARFADPEAAAFFELLAPGISVLGLVAVLWRVMLIRRTFGDGHEVPGVISAVGFLRGRGRIEYVYTYQSRKLLSGNAVQSSGPASRLTHGQAVTVMVDRINPKLAFVRELYL